MERKPWLANFGKGMLFGYEQPFLWVERCVTPQKTAAKETNLPEYKITIVITGVFSIVPDEKLAKTFIYIRAYSRSSGTRDQEDNFHKEIMREQSTVASCVIFRFDKFPRWAISYGRNVFHYTPGEAVNQRPLGCFVSLVMVCWIDKWIVPSLDNCEFWSKRILQI